MKHKILCVEGKYAGTPIFASQLEIKGYTVRSVTTGKDALSFLASLKPHVAVVNAPSMRTTGIRICQSLRDNKRKLPIVLIGKEGNMLSAEDVAADVVLALPFTVRKLNNRIKDFLPLQSTKKIKAGDLQLDLENHQARCHGRTTHLTPRLSCLLEILMRRVGEVVERDDLFRKVWETDFTDDTRTLDVHISWLRKAIEKDPRRPEYIKTLRGVGYRLDV
jgi:DNA-binding response OmpR family regulator